MNLIEATGGISRPADANGGCARRFPRRSICLLGRYTLASATEYPCQTINLSAGGAALFAPVQGRPGDRVVLHIDRIGRLEGKILRASRCGFVLEFSSVASATRIQRFLGTL
jgi:hypothetical protein